MKKVIKNSDELMQEFKDYNRENHFTPEGIRALFDYIGELEESGFEEYTLDVIEICVTFTEYESAKELKDSYNLDTLDDEDLEEFFSSVIIVDYPDGGIGYIVQE